MIEEPGISGRSLASFKIGRSVAEISVLPLPTPIRSAVTQRRMPSISTLRVNLSKNMANLTFYFENDKVGARISLAERDDYLTSIPGRNGTYVERTEGTTNIDFSGNFNFNENLKLTFEALNLTDESENQRLDATVLPANVVSYFHETGRQFYLGLRYQL